MSSRLRNGSRWTGQFVMVMVVLTTWLRFFRLPRSLSWDTQNRLFHRPRKFSTRMESCERSRLCSFYSGVSSCLATRLWGSTAPAPVFRIPGSPGSPMINCRRSWPVSSRVVRKRTTPDWSNIALPCILGILATDGQIVRPGIRVIARGLSEIFFSVLGPWRSRSASWRLREASMNASRMIKG
jgi:hypothetical protein